MNCILPEEKKESVKKLFQKKQPNNSALWCFFEGKMPGKIYADDINTPTKAICKLDMSWTYISDDADFEWIEETLYEIIKTDWIQVIWQPERRPQYPLKEFGKIIPRFEYIERKAPLKNPCEVELSPCTEELFDKLPEDYQEWHIQNYGSKKAFIEKTEALYTVVDGEVCCECESAFTSNGYTELGIYTFDPFRNRGYAFASCLRMLEDLDKKNIKAIWACDKENTASVHLAESLGFINPVEYDFIYFPNR